MQRIFLGLAVVTLLVLGANALVGLTGGDFHLAAREWLDASKAYETVQRMPGATTEEKEAALKVRAVEENKWLASRSHMTAHILLGSLSSLLVLLTCSVSITYFVGTSRWCREVAETYRLDHEYIESSARLKRRSFMWSVFCMMSIVGVVALGAAADPSAINYRRSAEFVQPHFLAAMCVTALAGFVFFKLWEAIRTNHSLIERILAEVKRVRTERGLETGAEA